MRRLLSDFLTGPHRWFGLGLFVFWIAGLLALPRYGITWDEPIVLGYADAVWSYIVHGDRHFLQMDDRYHGVWYSLVLKAIGALPWIQDVSVQYLWQHGMNFTVFCLGGVAMYWVLLQMGVARLYAALGVVLVLGHPRLWGHAVTNMKDIPFMVMWILATGCVLSFDRSPSVKRGVVLGCVFGAAIALRVVGGLIPLLWCCVFAWRYREQWKAVLTVVLNAVGAVVLLWPFLWENPFRLFEAIKGMSRYHWEGTVLYRGAFEWSTDLPWHYAVSWMGLTTPVLYVVLVVLAAIKCGLWLRRSESFVVNWRWVWVLCWAIVPLLLVSFGGAHLYDGWRHVFFVAPAWCVICVFGLPCRLRSVFTVVLCMGTVLISTASMFPYQSSFFNALAGDKETIRSRYEQDYWGSTYLECLKSVLAVDYRQSIPVYVANDPGKYNALLLPRHERLRFVFVESLGEADYFIGNFRWHPQDYSLVEPLYSVERDGMRLAVVYALR